jgi:aryl-alcohol dehydrogenase-like predicted oxidoreductase
MKYVNIAAGKPISKIGLGTWQFGSPEWNYGNEYAAVAAPKIVQRALELGVTLFDTAEIYGIEAKSASCRALVRGVAVVEPARLRGFGRSESILGDALRDGGDFTFIATKFYPAAPRMPSVRRHAAASARRLGTRSIDLYQVHLRGRTAPAMRTVRMLRELQADKVIANVGLSNATLEQWQAAEAALGRVVLSNQVPYSLVNRAAEQELLPYARFRERMIIAYSPLAHGLLSGRYDRSHRPTDSTRLANPLFQPENLNRAEELLRTLRDVAHAHQATPSQIALAWVIRHPSVAAIPGAASVEQLESNVAAADIELADDEYRALAAAAAAFDPVAPPRSRTSRLRSRVAGWIG